MCKNVKATNIHGNLKDGVWRRDKVIRIHLSVTHPDVGTYSLDLNNQLTLTEHLSSMAKCALCCELNYICIENLTPSRLLLSQNMQTRCFAHSRFVETSRPWLCLFFSDYLCCSLVTIWSEVKQTEQTAGAISLCQPLSPAVYTGVLALHRGLVLVREEHVYAN